MAGRTSSFYFKGRNESLGEALGTRLYPDAWASPAFPDFLRKVGIADYWDRVGAPSHCRKDATGNYRCQ